MSLTVSVYAPNAKQVVLGDINTFGLNMNNRLYRTSSDSGMWSGTFTNLPPNSTYSYYYLSVNNVWIRTLGQFETSRHMYQNNIIYPEAVSSTTTTIQACINATLPPLPNVVSSAEMWLSTDPAVADFVRANIPYARSTGAEDASAAFHGNASLDTFVEWNTAGVRYNLLLAQSVAPATIAKIALSRLTENAYATIGFSSWGVTDANVNTLSVLQQNPYAVYIFVARIATSSNPSAFFPFYTNVFQSQFARAAETVHFVPGPDIWAPSCTTASAYQAFQTLETPVIPRLLMASDTLYADLEAFLAAKIANDLASGRVRNALCIVRVPSRDVYASAWPIHSSDDIFPLAAQASLKSVFASQNAILYIDSSKIEQSSTSNYFTHLIVNSTAPWPGMARVELNSPTQKALIVRPMYPVMAANSGTSDDGYSTTDNVQSRLTYRFWNMYGSNTVFALDPLFGASTVFVSAYLDGLAATIADMPLLVVPLQVIEVLFAALCARFGQTKTLVVEYLGGLYACRDWDIARVYTLRDVCRSYFVDMLADTSTLTTGLAFIGTALSGCGAYAPCNTQQLAVGDFSFGAAHVTFVSSMLAYCIANSANHGLTSDQVAFLLGKSEGTNYLIAALVLLLCDVFDAVDLGASLYLGMDISKTQDFQRALIAHKPALDSVREKTLVHENAQANVLAYLLADTMVCIVNLSATNFPTYVVQFAVAIAATVAVSVTQLYAGGTQTNLLNSYNYNPTSGQLALDVALQPSNFQLYSLY